MAPSRWAHTAAQVGLLLAIASPLPASATADQQDPQTRGVTRDDAAPPLSQQGRYFALVVGIDDYRSPVPKLKTAVQDASDVGQILTEHYGFETKLLLNATRDQIKRALGEYRRTLTENASLLIYYAGHGYYDHEADKAYWLPSDAEEENNSNWIIADEITTDTKVIPAGHILIVSDSCYSGGITRDLNAAVAPREREQYLRKALQGKSRTLISSGGNEPVADGGGGGHSVFANALLRGLNEIGGDVFTARDLFDQFILVPVAGKSDQTPEYNPIRNSGHDSGDFVFFRKKNVHASPIISEAAAHANQGKVFQSNNRYAEAEAEFVQAIKLEPRVAEYHDYLGWALLSQKKYAEAETEYRQAIKLAPERAWYHTHLAGAFVGQHKPADAEAELREALKLDPANPVHIADVAGVLFLQAKYADAEAEFRRAVALTPGLTRNRGSFGGALFFQRKYAEAESELRQFLKLEPTNSTAHGILALVMRESGWRTAEAEAELQEAVRLDPASFADKQLKGLRLARHADSLLGSGRYAEAEAELRQALTFDSSSRRYRNTLGIALYRQGKREEAATEMGHVVNDEPESAQYQNNLATVLYSLEKYADAEAADRRAVAVDGNNPGFRNSLGNDLYAQQKYAEAEVEFARAVDLAPKVAGYHADFGAALYRQRKFAESEAAFRESLKLDSSVAYHHVGLGRALESQGKQADAEAAYREALRLNPNDTNAQEGLKRLHAKKQ